MKLVATLLLSGFFFLSSAANAQTVPAVDSTTYRQFFVIVTADRSALPQTTTGSTAMPVVSDAVGVSERQLAHLKSAGLNDSDALVAAGILLDFRTQYDQLVTEYNNLPETRAGTNNATPVFLSRMENLVQATIYNLNSSLSVAGTINLNAYLQDLAASQPRVASKPLTIYPKSSKAALINAAYHQGGATLKPAVVINGCTLTPHYDEQTTLTFGELLSVLNPYMTSSGFTLFSPSVLTYGPDSKHPYGLGTNTSTAGAWFIVNYAAAGYAPQALDQANVYETAAGDKGIYTISYADSYSGPYTQVARFEPGSTSTTIKWVKQGAHYFWKFVLTNTPGTSPYWTTLQLFVNHYAFVKGLTEGYSSVSGNCSGMTVGGSGYSLFDGFVCTGTGPMQSPTSWVSVLDSGYDLIQEIPGDTHNISWYGQVAALGGSLLFSSSSSRHTMFAYTRAVQLANINEGTNCANGWGINTICDFAAANWCTDATTPPDLNVTKIRYDYAFPLFGGRPWGWEVFGEVFRVGTSGPWTGGTNLLQFAFPDYSTQLKANCSYHP